MVTSSEVVVIVNIADLLITRRQQILVEIFKKANAIEAHLAVFFTTSLYVETTHAGDALEDHPADFSMKGHPGTPDNVLDHAPGLPHAETKTAVQSNAFAGPVCRLAVIPVYTSQSSF